MRKPKLKPNDVYPAHVLRDEHGMNAANRPTIVVNSDEVPDALRPLIPYVERWAIACEVTRGDYFEHQPTADIAAFWHDLLPHVKAINQWLKSLPEDTAAWPEAAVHFLYLLAAHDDAYQPSDEEKLDLKKKEAEWKQKQKREKAIEKALDAFQRKDYATVARELAPFEAELEKSTKAKLDFARKKAGI